MNSRCDGDARKGRLQSPVYSNDNWLSLQLQVRRCLNTCDSSAVTNKCPCILRRSGDIFKDHFANISFLDEEKCVAVQTSCHITNPCMLDEGLRSIILLEAQTFYTTQTIATANSWQKVLLSMSPLPNLFASNFPAYLFLRSLLPDWLKVQLPARMSLIHDDLCRSSGQ